MKLDSKKIIQITVVVRDIEKTTKNVAKLFDVDLPEIFAMEKLGELYAEFEGEPTTASILIANFNMGDVTLEFIQPVDDKPSTFKAFLDENGEGIHHFGIIVSDIEGAKETLNENDLKLRHWGTYPGGSYYIADTRDFMGTLLNIKHIGE